MQLSHFHNNVHISHSLIAKTEQLLIISIVNFCFWIVYEVALYVYKLLDPGELPIWKGWSHISPLTCAFSLAWNYCNLCETNEAVVIMQSNNQQLLFESVLHLCKIWTEKSFLFQKTSDVCTYIFSEKKIL